MYKAILSGSTTGKSGRIYRYTAGKEVEGNPGKDELKHSKSVIWIDEDTDRSSDYTISELRDMDLSDKGDEFFEGDTRETIDKLR